MRQRKNKEFGVQMGNRGDSTGKEKRRKQRLWKMFLVVTFLIIIPGIFFSFAYKSYGIHYFIPLSMQRLSFTAEQWQNEILPKKLILMVGGPHRGGTTILWECIRQHPDISDFGNTDDTAIALSEGVFMQDVYPKWGLGDEPTNMKGRKSATTYKGGLGQYALLPEQDVHLDETSDLVNPASQARLLNRFGYFWNMSSPVLLEKSPPNAVISRFLQALINLQVPGGFQGYDSPAGISQKGESRVRFVFTTRHPLANALAHMAWPFCRGIPLETIVENWMKVNEYMSYDIPYLQHVKHVKLEEFQENPNDYLDDIYSWLGLDPTRANRTVDRAKEFGYSIAEWANCPPSAK
ncbi:hypothetical protein AAMO2058_000846500 [Amorphochlora amoebiformis]